MTAPDPQKKIVENKAALIDSELRLDFILELVKGGDWDLDLLTGKAICSFRHDQCFGATAPIPEWNYEKFLTYVHPDDRENTHSKFQAAVASGDDWSIDCRVIWDDGSIHWIQSSGRNYRYVDGKPTRMLGMVREVTEEKQRLEKIRGSEQRFGSLVENAIMPICLFKGEDLVLEIANAPFLAIWKVGKEAIGKPLLEILPELKNQPIIPRLLDVYHHGATHNLNEIPAYFIRKNGEKEARYFNFVYQPYSEADGTTAGVMAMAVDITEQFVARKKIEDSETQLAFAIDAANLGVWDYNPITNKFKANDRMRDWFGFKKNEEFDLSLGITAMVESDRQRVAEAIQKASTWGGGDYEIEYTINHLQTGQSRVVRAKGKATFDEDKIAYRFNGTLQDVTAQALANKLLEESEKRFRTLADESPIFVYIVEPTEDVAVSYWNKTWLQYTGQTMEEALGNAWEGIVHPDDVAVVFEIFASAFANHQPYFLPAVRTKRYDGEYRWFSYKSNPRFLADGTFSGYVGVGFDIHDQKVAGTILKESEEKFRLLADAMPQHIWTSDTNGDLNYFNKSVFDYSGLTIAQINERGWIQIVHPDDRAENIKQWANAIATGNDFIFEHRFRRYDGEYRWQLSRAIPQKDDEGNIRMWVGTSTDIQEQKIREDKKDEFISIASHELKTPLTTAKAYLEVLELSIDANKEDAKLYAKKAIQSLNRLNKLIGELLDVSKIRLGKLNYNITTFNFNDMIDSTVENLQLISPSHTIIKSGKVSDEPSGDKDRLQQVVINLLTNAIKYSPNADKVFITIEQGNGNIQVSVKDMGIGIAKQSLDKIFDKYHRVEEHALQFQGLGIGLFISYEIIQRHHGKLWAESEPAKGSTFYFTLPVKPTIPIQ